MELVVVMALLAIIAAMAAPRSVETTAYAERGFAIEAAAAARYSRGVAITSGCAVEFRVAAAQLRARQQVAAGAHCNAASNAFTVPVLQGGGAALTQSVPPGVAVPRAIRWVFRPDGTATSGGRPQLAIGRYQLTLDPATGYVSAP